MLNIIRKNKKKHITHLNRSIGARDGGQQKFPSPEVDENVDDPCPSGRDGGQQKFPSPDPCNRKKRSEQSGRDGGQQKFPSPEEKRSEQSGRDGGQQKFPSPEEKRSGIVSDTDPTSLQTGLGIEKKAELNPYNRMGNLQKRLNPHHRMVPNFDKRSDDDAIIIEEKRDNSNLFRPLPKNPEEEGTIVEVKRLNPNNRMAQDFGKRSAQAEWQTNTNPLFRPLNENTVDEPNIVSVKRSAQADWQDLPDVFRPLNENTGDGANEDAIVSVKRSAQADWQDLPDVFRPLPQTENTIIQVKRGENMNPFNRMAEVNPFNRMATPPSKRNNCASNSPSVVSISTFSNKERSFMLTGSNNQF
jgi:hypothetical protein